MSDAKVYSFRLTDPQITKALNAMPERSDFIRSAILEKINADNDAPSEASSEGATEASRIALEAPADPNNSGPGETQRLRDGLTAIAHSTTAILDAFGKDMPEDVSVGLIGIAEAAAILAAEGPGGGENGDPPVDLSAPASEPRTGIIGTVELEITAIPDPGPHPESASRTDDPARTGDDDPAASGQPELPLLPAPDTTPEHSTLPDTEDSQ